MILMILLTIVLSTTPCEYEDSNNCYWVGPLMGNQGGDSYITINDTTYYLPQD